MVSRSRFQRSVSLLLITSFAGLTACVTPYQGQFDQTFQVPTDPEAPAALKVGLVVPPEVEAATLTMEDGCSYTIEGSKRLSVPFGRELKRLAAQQFSQTFTHVDLLPSAQAGSTQYDALIVLRPPTPTLAQNSILECTAVMIFAGWLLIPFIIPLPVDMDLGVSATLTDPLGQTIIEEARSSDHFIFGHMYQSDQVPPLLQVSLAKQLHEVAVQLRAAPAVASLIQNRQRALEAERQAVHRQQMAKVVELERDAHAAETRGERRTALARLMDAMRLTEDGQPEAMRLRERIIAVARRLDPPPAIPEEACRHLVVGSSKVKEAQTPEDYRTARELFTRAARQAPWAPEVYFNLSLVSEKLEEYRGAAEYLKLYLRAAPNAPDAREIQDHIYVLEGKAGGK